MFTKDQIRTLYLIPHSHTDIGYTHDPVMVWELHDRFLDQAITLCEATASAPPEARFHWTIEVFASLEHWWGHRDARWHERLLGLMREGCIDVGARRLNGTFLSDAHDIRWELERTQAFAREHGVRINTAFNNDVNGFSLGYAQELVRHGVDGLVMGLNTTMGITPFPRPNAWRWVMPSGEAVLVWNGFIYNRLKCFLNFDRLAAELPGRLEALFANYPGDYPFDFAMANAVVDDNTGPIATLPEQVRQFNAAGHGLRLVITTVSGFMDRVKTVAAQLPEQRGDWNDAWSFYLGSLPQCVAAARRAQRRLALVEGIRRQGWANETGGSLTLDAARAELAVASEHTNGSHSASGEPGSTDTQRQWAQIAVSSWKAEGMAMSLLRDHLAVVSSFPHNRNLNPNPDPPSSDSAVIVNPTEHPLSLRLLYEPTGFRRFADPTRPEHLLQFDREPTRNAFENDAGFGVERVEAPAGTVKTCALGSLSLVRHREAQPLPGVVTVENEMLRLTVDPVRLGLVSLITKADGREWIQGASAFAGGAPVSERLVHPAGFQVAVPNAVRDPSDTPWTNDHRFERTLLGRVAAAEKCAGSEGVGVALRVENSPVREMVFRLDALRPDVVEVTVKGWLDADVSQRGIYLPFEFAAETGRDIRFLYDSGGLWQEAGRDQLPGSATSHYASWRGMQFGLWFECERAMRGTWAVREHPELFWPDPCGGDAFHLNLARRDAQDWLIELISGWISRLDLRWSRFDYNIRPAAYWHTADPTGKIQFAYVQGLYRVFDELRRRHPGWMIENCASGGRRIDLGTLARTHSNWLNDWTLGPQPTRWMQLRAQQFLPVGFTNTNVVVKLNAGDPDNLDHHVLSHATGKLEFNGDFAGLTATGKSRCRHWTDLYKQYRHILGQDFYQLSRIPESVSDWDVVQWAAYDGSEGLIAAYRIAGESEWKGSMRGIAPGAEYAFTDLATGRQWKVAGETLRREGITIMLESNSACLWRWRRN